VASPADSLVSRRRRGNAEKRTTKPLRADVPGYPRVLRQRMRGKLTNVAASNVIASNQTWRGRQCKLISQVKR
jgi:hypothetical protein